MASRAIRILENQVAVLTTLVRDLSAELPVDTDNVRLNLRAIDINEALRDAVDEFTPEAERRAQAFQLVLPPIDIVVTADPMRLQQMLLNLIGNAIKYTPEGGSITLSASVEDGAAVIRVEDDGIGITAEALPHVFELFGRERRDAHVDGFGIGLAVVRKFALLHGGSVEARRPGPGLGSVFGLRLPLPSQVLAAAG